MTTSREWRKIARCAPPADTPDFFDQTAEGVERSKLFCEACPVKTECLEYAMQTEAHYSEKIVTEQCGVWGGKDGKERIAIRRTRNAAKEG